MGLLDYLRGRSSEPEERTGIYPLSMASYVDQALSYFKYGGNLYSLTGMPSSDTEQKVSESFESFVTNLWRSNGIVYACMGFRLRVFSDVRFRFRQLDTNGTASYTMPTDGRNPASASLRLLRRPEPGLTTTDLLAHAIQDRDLAGNWFGYRSGNRLQRLRPDWVTVVYGSRRKDASIWDLDSELLGYLYKPGGMSGTSDPIALLPEQVAHWAPQPDPMSPRLGMSWLTPIVREILADSAATTHKQAFFENDATVNQQLVFDKEIDKDTFDYAVEKFKENHEGVGNAYRTLFVLGAKLEKVGLDFAEMDFTNLQGKMETRIASAAGVGPIVTFLSEGLQGSSLNAGNYNSARRSVADATFRPEWRSFCSALANIVDEPEGSELWYDDRDCLFLQEDRKDAADIELTKAQTIKALSEGGFEPDSVVRAVMAEDMGLLRHTGMLSVQLQEPGKQQPSTDIQTGPPKQDAPPEQKSMEIFARALSDAVARKAPDVFEFHAAPVTVTQPNIEVNTPDVQLTLPDINVETPKVEVHSAPVDIHPAPVSVVNNEVGEEELRTLAESLRPPGVDLAPVAKMIGEIEARRMLDAERAEQSAAERHAELVKELKPPAPAKLVRRVERDANGLLVRIVDEPEEETG